MNMNSVPNPASLPFLPQFTSLEVREKDEDPVLASVESPPLFGLPSTLPPPFTLPSPMKPSNKSMARDKHKSPVEVTYRKQFEPAHLAQAAPASIFTVWL